MSGRRLTRSEVIKAYPCPVCTAGPGDNCHSITGRTKYEPHADRSRLASQNGWQVPET